MNLFFSSELRILSGESIFEVIKLIYDYSPIAVGINCVYPQTFFSLLNKIEFNQRWGFYLNCGSGRYSDNLIFEGISPQNYIEIIKQVNSKNIFFIGTCCGSNPAHTEAIKEYYDRCNYS